MLKFKKQSETSGCRRKMLHRTDEAVSIFRSSSHTLRSYVQYTNACMFKLFMQEYRCITNSAHHSLNVCMSNTVSLPMYSSLLFSLPLPLTDLI